METKNIAIAVIASVIISVISITALIMLDTPIRDSLIGPQGPQGIPGPQGPQGIQGEAFQLDDAQTIYEKSTQEYINGKWVISYITDLDLEIDSKLDIFQVYWEVRQGTNDLGEPIFWVTIENSKGEEFLSRADLPTAFLDPNPGSGDLYWATVQTQDTGCITVFGPGTYTLKMRTNIHLWNVKIMGYGTDLTVNEI